MNFFAACARLKGFECEDPLDTAAVSVFIPCPEAVLKGGGPCATSQGPPLF